MKGKFLPFLILPVLVFALFLVFSPTSVKAASGTSWGEITWGECLSSGPQCGTDNGTQTGLAICERGECRQLCSLGTWVNTTYQHRSCDRWGLWSCKSWGDWEDGPRKKYWQEEKVNVPGHYINPETKNYSRSCSTGILQYDSCPVKEECPTACGLSASQVDDGKGGKIDCSATNSCSTYRWCFPDEESETGFLAQAISVSIPTPEIGKPWDSGKMLDKYCSYVPAGTCPTACGLPASQVDDGKGGKIDCPATEACPVDIEEEIPVEDEPVVLAVTDKVEDKPEVKAATSQVVLAETGSTNSMFVYIVQAILTVSTILSGIFFSKKYIM